LRETTDGGSASEVCINQQSCGIGEVLGNHYLHDLSKSGWSWGYVSALDSQGGGQSGLLMHIAVTESVSLCERMKS
jgi:hypothetical protein